jgi:hypothetical protein
VKEKKWFQAYLRKCKRQEERTKVKALEPQDSEQSIQAELNVGIQRICGSAHAWWDSGLS